MVQFIKGSDLTAEQKTLVKQGRFIIGIYDPSGQSERQPGDGWQTRRSRPMTPVEIEKHIIECAWCFTDDGKRRSKYSGWQSIRAEAADAQNAHLRELKVNREAGFRRHIPWRPVGKLTPKHEPCV